MKKTIIMLGYILVLLNLIVLLCSIPTMALSDVSPSEWARESIDYAVALGFVPENMQSNYQNDITRGEFAELAVRFVVSQYNYYEKGTPDIDGFLQSFLDSKHGLAVSAVTFDHCLEMIPTELQNFFPDGLSWDYVLHNMVPFSDMIIAKEDHLENRSTYLQQQYFVNIAYVLGIVNGYTDGSFRPDMPISRQEAAAMLYRVYKVYRSETTDDVVNSDVLDSFSDCSLIGSWAKGYVTQAVTWDLMNGVSNGCFSPLTHYTREQCYTTFVRLFSNMPTSRLKENVPRITTIEEDSAALKNGLGTDLDIYLCCETDKATILLAHISGLPHGAHYYQFYLLYHLGGIHIISAPERINMDSFGVIDNDQIIFLAEDTSYLIDLRSGTLVKQ